MVKHTQTIRCQIADELFECVWPFCEIGAWRVKVLQQCGKRLKTKSQTVLGANSYVCGSYMGKTDREVIPVFPSILGG